MTVFPKPTSVTTVPITVATDGSEEAKVHVPGEVDVGSLMFREVMPPPENEPSSKGPSTGLSAVIASVF